MKSFLEWIHQRRSPPSYLDQIFIPTDENSLDVLSEGNWFNGRFSSNIRVDHPNYGAGHKHAHVYGRKGKELVAVNFDGTGSHGTRGKLHDCDADALRTRGFNIRSDNIVEWVLCGEFPRLILG